MNRYTVNEFTRIHKNKARKIWTTGATPVYACPCKLRPGAPWSPEVMIPTGTGASFDQLANAATYYNCTPETGRYLAYYIAEGVLPR